MAGVKLFMNSFLVILVNFNCNFEKVASDGVLSIRLLDYNNTGSIKYSGDCCDGQATESGECVTDLCDYAIRICVTDSVMGRNCIPETGTSYLSVGTDLQPIFTFPADTERNRIYFDTWTGKASIEVSVMDVDSLQNRESIDIFTLEYDRQSPLHRPPRSDNKDYELRTLTGTRKVRPSQLHIGIVVHCRNNYYTDNCTEFCLPSNDCNGHYSCDNVTGAKICNKGWEGVNCSQPKALATRCADSNYCSNGGTCAQTMFDPIQPYCCCPEGFTGLRCEQDVDECQNTPCVHGSCVDTPGSYNCSCGVGYGGKNCDRNVICADQPCQNGGKCQERFLMNTYIFIGCTCPEGFTGDYCDVEITTTTPMTTTTTPVATTTKATTTSTTEESTTSPVTTTGMSEVKCSSRYNYCRNKGQCINGSCKCQAGFTGALCQIEILECRSYPCQNGGHCNDLLGQYSCDCPDGFRGDNCEKRVTTTTLRPTASSNNCFMCEHGVCKLGLSGSFCDCETGFSGKTCSVHEQKRCGTSEDAFCLKDDTCRIKSRDVNACKKDWKGPLCRNSTAYSVNDPECPDIACKNDGHCYNGMCCCREGFSGRYCEYEVLHCMSDPCLNGGSCINLFNGFQCICTKNFSGEQCEMSLISTTLRTIPSSTTLQTSSTQGTSTQSTTPTTPSTTQSTTSSTSTETTIQTSTQSMNQYTSSTELPLQPSTSTPPTRSTTSLPPEKQTTATSPFSTCSGVRCFLNNTCIDTSYGQTRCTCFLEYISLCDRVDFPTQTTVTRETSSLQTTGSSSTFSAAITSTTQQQTSASTSALPETTKVATTVMRTTKGPTTVMPTTKRPTTNGPVASTTAPSTTSPRTNNHTVILNGKIPEKDLGNLENLINIFVANSSQGINCKEIRLLAHKYVYNITKHPFTSLTFDGSNCWNDSNSGANNSFNANLAKVLANSGTFQGHGLYTGNPGQFGISYSLYLIGYVYERNTEVIKRNIKQTWEEEGNTNIDVLIINKNFFIGNYGILLTEIPYLVAHGTHLVPSTEARPPSDAQMRRVFMMNIPVVNFVHTRDIRIPYLNGFRTPVETVTRASAGPLQTLKSTLHQNWRKFLADKGMCSSTCKVDVMFAPREDSFNRLGSAESDLVYFPFVNRGLLDNPGINPADMSVLYKNVRSCNCTTTRTRYIDIRGRLKLRKDQEIKEAIANVTQGMSYNVWWKVLFVDTNGNIVTRMNFVPKGLKEDNKAQWPNPNMDGLMDSYNKSLIRNNEICNFVAIKRILTIKLKNSVDSTKMDVLKQTILDTTYSSNPHFRRGDIEVSIFDWDKDYCSESGGLATKVLYTVSIAEADSSVVDFTKPSSTVMTDELSKVKLTTCNCIVRRIRRLWMEDRKEVNSSTVEQAITNAWKRANLGVPVDISTSIRNTESGYKSDTDGKPAVKFLYYVSPMQGNKAVDEDDLDEPSDVELEEELRKLVPGIHVYTHNLNRTSPKSDNWWIYLAIGLGIAAVLIIILISALIGVRAYRHRQSETLKQDPKTVHGFSKEHFSKEPVIEKNSNGFYGYDDEDMTQHSSTYVVNS